MIVQNGTQTKFHIAEMLLNKFWWFSNVFGSVCLENDYFGYLMALGAQTPSLEIEWVFLYVLMGLSLLTIIPWLSDAFDYITHHYLMYH